MTVQDLTTALSLTVFHLAEPQRPVTGGYCGDLLSWVMGQAQADQVWLTIMSNGNVAAVASLTDVACVLLTESVRPDEDLLAKAKAHGVNLLGCDDTTFLAACRLAEALK